MSDAGHMTSRIEETHKADWHNYAGAGSLLSCILPVLSEFEGVGADLLMGVGGASAASAFVVLMKIGRVTAVVNDLTVEQDEIHAEMDEEEAVRVCEEEGIEWVDLADLAEIKAALLIPPANTASAI